MTNDDMFKRSVEAAELRRTTRMAEILEKKDEERKRSAPEPPAPPEGPHLLPRGGQLRQVLSATGQLRQVLSATEMAEKCDDE